jgi:hypothetical protein
MRRRSRLLRVAKRGGVVVCAAFFGVLVVGIRTRPIYWGDFTFGDGKFVYWHSELFIAPRYGTLPPLSWPESLGRAVELPSWSASGVLSVPLWCPVAITVLITAVVFCLDGRRPIRGHCRCGYDLTGNVSGTCPECGVEVQA